MPMRIGTEMPSFAGATDWLTGGLEEATAETKDHPTLVHFWAISCGICKDNMPRVNELRDTYREKGLRVIAVHMPRYPDDMDLAAVRQAIEKYNITEPCAVDNQHKLRDEFKNDAGYVPAYYFFDAEGKLRGFAAGERGLDLVTPTIRRVLES